MKKYIFLITLFFILAFLYFWQGIFLPKDPSLKKEQIFLVEKGEGTREIAFNLDKQGLIKSAPLFRIYTFLKKVSGQLQAGEYSLSPSMAIPEIAEKLAGGDVIKVVITFPEGFTINEVEERLSEKGINVKSKIKNQKSKIYKAEFKFLEDLPDEFNLEGYLFPDTYQFSYRISPEEIIRKMLANFDKKLTSDLREEIKRQKKSIFEIVIMASLIEKEVRIFEDKKLVSGILWKRLQNDIPLQVDATISYILSDSEKYPERHITGKKTTEISIEETKIDSPYNTYKYQGLPLGPIANPGLDSILAVLYPKDSKFWYYLSTPEGETIFSKTFEEHNIAKAKYLK